MKSTLFYCIFALILTGMAFSGPITVITPNGGEQLLLDKDYNIRWSYTGDPTKVKIVLVTTGQSVRLIADNIDATALTYKWPVGATTTTKATPGSGYKIRIRIQSTDPDAPYDDSNSTFSIIQPRVVFTTKKLAQLGIKILTPTKNTRIKTGEMLLIKWEGAPNTPHQIELYNHDGTKKICSIGESNTGGRMWQVPHSVFQLPGFFKIRVSRNNGQVEAFSQKFKIDLKIVEKKYTVNAVTVNKTRCVKKETSSVTSGFSGAHCNPEVPDPGAGKARVGFSGKKGDNWIATRFYRSHVYFDVRQFQGKGLLKSARLVYSQYSGGQCGTKVFSLDQRWTGSLFEVAATYQPNVRELRSVVQKWIAYPDDNYGLVITGPLENIVSRECVALFHNIKLELEFIGGAE